jgi:hypothetical protein
MANDPKVEAIYIALYGIIESVDKAPAKERDNFVSQPMVDQFNTLRKEAIPFVKFSELVPAAVGKGLSGVSTIRYVDLRSYAMQIRDMLPYTLNI